MKPLQKIISIATPLDIVNVDTDQIIPKQFLKLIQRTGFGQYLFYDWRYKREDDGRGGIIIAPRKDFILNDPFYINSKILLARDNFGCGSSREHAVWALVDYGFKVIISTSFADIFYNNCFKNGILPIKISPEILEKLLLIKSEIEVDLQNQTIKASGISVLFHIESHWRRILLEGLDDIAITLEFEDKILNYEKSQNLNSKIPYY
jgi:3-isopropylmalate/(R)-2-methylmalate dehydratase small subunit